MKISILGCGLRTPLLLSGLLRSKHIPEEVLLFDLDPRQSELMLNLGKAAEPGVKANLKTALTAEEAIDGCDFVISSIRPGGMERRARDERISLDAGYTGQETVGPAGCAMAWRSIPAVLGYARLMERLAPKAWLINFTNPAGVVTQAVHDSSPIKTVGICDTPAELFLRIGFSFGVSLEDVDCEYVGLNHCGFVRRVRIRGVDRTEELIGDDDRLRSLYPADLFPPQLIRHLTVIPSEYVFFYFRPDLARNNQRLVGRTRGEELLAVNGQFYEQVHRAASHSGWQSALNVYSRYLNHRNASYLQLEGDGNTAIGREAPDWDPFAAETGYHRIAVQTIQALSGSETHEMVLNVPNEGCLPSLNPDDIVEINCRIGPGGVKGIPQDPIPESVRGLIEQTKEFERILVRAALANDETMLVWAMTQNPLVRDWDQAEALVRQLHRHYSEVVG